MRKYLFLLSILLPFLSSYGVENHKAYRCGDWWAYVWSTISRTVDISPASDVNLPPTVDNIPTTVTIEGDTYTVESISGFGGRDIRRVIIPDGVWQIHNNAFKNCSELESVEIPKSVTEINNYAFQGCTSLKSFTIPESVTTIRSYAFQGCTGLESITIPRRIEKLGNQVWDGCDNIKEVTYLARTPIKAPNDIFTSQVYDTATLLVPGDAIQNFMEVTPWNYFWKIQDNVSAIDTVKADAVSDEASEVYNLSGVKVGDTIDGLQPGIYIVRQGANTKKIAVK